MCNISMNIIQYACVGIFEHFTVLQTVKGWKEKFLQGLYSSQVVVVCVSLIVRNRVASGYHAEIHYR